MAGTVRALTMSGGGSLPASMWARSLDAGMALNGTPGTFVPSCDSEGWADEVPIMARAAPATRINAARTMTMTAGPREGLRGREAVTVDTSSDQAYLLAESC